MKTLKLYFLSFLILIISWNFKIRKSRTSFSLLRILKCITPSLPACVQLVRINGKFYVGHQRKSYFEDKNNPRLKSILLPIEAWTTFVTQAITTLDKGIKEHHTTQPAPPPETAKGRKRPNSNGILTLTFLTLIHSGNQESFSSSLTQI